MVNKFIIAISREFGSGGGEIAHKLSEKLGVPCYDKTVAELTSVASGFSVETINNSEDKVSNIFEYSTFSHNNFLPVYDQIYIAQHNVIKELSEKNSCIIVGRCAAAILKDNPYCMKVFICAPLENRINRIIQQHQIGREEAIKLIDKIDKRRKNYYKKYAGMEWDKIQNYDITVNTKIGIDESVEIIISALNKLYK